MAANPMAQLVQYLRKAAMLQEGEGRDDAVLLGAYIGRRDGAAFEALMRRHGPMVLGVCRRILGNVHDADDAFQATFLVLINKAASIRKREAVGNWLHGVAQRTALESRRANARRGGLEKQVLHMPHPQINPGESWQELGPVLDKELSTLPEKYRLPVVLCDLEGRTRKHVARQLGIPEGTLSNRLATARKLLAKRLARHGFGLSSAALAAMIAQNGASAALPMSVVSATVKVATATTAGKVAATGLVSVKVATLTEGVLKTMLLTKIKNSIAVLLVLGVTTLGTGEIIIKTLASEPAGGMTNLQEQSQAKPGDATLANLFKFRVPFETGHTESKEGGSIEIREVWGTRPRIEVGGQYLVRGKYVLPPGERGKLYFYATASGAWGAITTTLDLQTVALDKQEGEFTLVHGMSGPGYFHLYLADPERYSRWFANVYFGTGDNVWGKKLTDTENDAKGYIAEYLRLVQTDPSQKEALLQSTQPKDANPRTKDTRVKSDAPGYDRLPIVSEKGGPVVKAWILRIDQRDIYIQVNDNVHAVHIGSNVSEGLKAPLSAGELKRLDLLKLVKDYDPKK